MAKGVEDTAFYCFNRMIGMNEVGGAPDRNGMTLAEFHEYCAKMQINASANHDDACPRTTPSAPTMCGRGSRRSLKFRASGRAVAAAAGRAPMHPFGPGRMPDRNTEYFLYQTLIGAWPIDKDRLIAYMEKATREAEQRTSWTQQNTEFEASAARRLLSAFSSRNRLSRNLENFVARILDAGRINSLAQTLLKCTAPGVPDTYQGGELWDLSLVDPDNRRPVDYDLRREMLIELQDDMDVEEIVRGMDSGLPKLWVIHKALYLRREHPDWFGAEAAYTPIVAEGSKSDHLVGFQRGDSVAVLVPRWPLKLAAYWAATTVNCRRDNGETFLRAILQWEARCVCRRY